MKMQVRILSGAPKWKVAEMFSKTFALNIDDSVYNVKGFDNGKELIFETSIDDKTVEILRFSTLRMDYIKGIDENNDFFTDLLLSDLDSAIRKKIGSESTRRDIADNLITFEDKTSKGLSYYMYRKGEKVKLHSPLILRTNNKT